ncbi:MAG TPA: beta-ketoacyl synthase N-terminal-like domain-containing protein, partial [Dongiaceae bacterium]|nr:beta-ketoacyl synthase N-terminal-like domain-containing protein [Dongiaceae bacterium]
MDIKQLVTELTPLSHKQLMVLAIKQNEQLQQQPALVRDDIAIIGLHCITPGADSPEGFWDTLMQRKDVLKDARTERFPLLGVQLDHHQLPQRAYSYTAGLIEGIDQFDPAFFGISPREARGMDPQQRLVLQCTVQALANAGYEWDALRNSRTGVFVGVAANEYNLFQDVLNGEEDASHAASGNALNVIAGRVAYTLGLQGPAIALDTACSSSLVALHTAVESLQAGDCEQAIVGGVNVILSPATFMLLCQNQMLAPDGRCKTFDKDANGYVRAEAVASLILKPLTQARRDGDRILACIKGSAVNQDGRSAGLTVPSSTAQQAVIEAALARAKLSPEQIEYVECHGTGTALGDPIEVQALAQAYCNSDRAPLILGAAKSCIGHAESAAGLVGLVKAVLSLQHDCIPPQAHFNQWNPLIHVDPKTLHVPTAATPWPRRNDGLRRCAVSSFGFSGTNAHVILEEYQSAADCTGRAPLAPVQFNLQRYWWRHPVDPISGVAGVSITSTIASGAQPLQVASVEEAVTACVARISGQDVATLKSTFSLSADLGFDSLMTGSLRDQLSRLLQHPQQDRVPLQIFFGQDSLGEIVAAVTAAGFELAQQNLALGSRDSVNETYQPDAAAQEYFAARTAQFDADHPSRVTRKLVHKSLDENVLVADLVQLNDKEFLAEMTQDRRHPYFYEHFLDHVPGLYVVEAVRQAATALCHLFRDVDYSHAFILNQLTVSFSHFIETDQPAFIHLRIADETVRDGRVKLMEVDARVLHQGREVARITGGGDVSSRDEYAGYRGEALAAATQAAKSSQVVKPAQEEVAAEIETHTGRVIACFDLDGTLTH